jgi:hypothetical protein
LFVGKGRGAAGAEQRIKADVVENEPKDTGQSCPGNERAEGAG